MPTVTISLDFDEYAQLNELAEKAEAQRQKERGGEGGRQIVPATIAARLVRRGLKKEED